MADCKSLATCPFFNDKMPDDQGLGAIYKKKYCQTDSAKCARFMVSSALGSSKVPTNLYPNQQDKAKELITKG